MVAIQDGSGRAEKKRTLQKKGTVTTASLGAADLRFSKKLITNLAF